MSFNAEAIVSLTRFRKEREDLLARINLWTFQLPGLAQRVEDIEPNLDHELEAAGKRVMVGGNIGYPVSAQVEASTAAHLVRWYDFLVEHGELLNDPSLTVDGLEDQVGVD